MFGGSSVSPASENIDSPPKVSQFAALASMFSGI